MQVVQRHMLPFLLHADSSSRYHIVLRSSLYSANARTNPPIKAIPPFAMLATAAFGVEEGLDVEEGVEEVCDTVLRAVVRVDTSVRFELGDALARVEVEVKLALVEVETTVTVDEGAEEVVVLV